MSGRGCVDFFVIFRKQFHRTHTQPHLLNQASPVKNREFTKAALFISYFLEINFTVHTTVFVEPGFAC